MLRCVYIYIYFTSYYLFNKIFVCYIHRMLNSLKNNDGLCVCNNNDDDHNNNIVDVGAVGVAGKRRKSYDIKMQSKKKKKHEKISKIAQIFTRTYKVQIMHVQAVCSSKSIRETNERTNEHRKRWTHWKIVCENEVEASFVCKLRSNIHFIQCGLLCSNVYAMAGTEYDHVSNRELRVEFRFRCHHSAILHSFIHIFLLPVLEKGRLGIRLTHLFVSQVCRTSEMKGESKFQSKKNETHKHTHTYIHTNGKISYKHPKHTQSTGIHSFRST